MDFQVRPARRERGKARIAFDGPAGSGKTHSSLLMAHGLIGSLGTKRRSDHLIPDGKGGTVPAAHILVGDTENNSACLEQGKPGIPEFDVVCLDSPFTPEKYIAFLHYAADNGYEVVSCDGISPEWAGKGGLLETHGKMEDRGANTWSAWRNVTPKHNSFIDEILRSPIHVFCTMRTKTEWTTVLNEKNKVEPKKVGLAPVQREGFDYEMTIVFDIDQATHTARASKDRTSLFDGAEPFKISFATGDALRKWLESGDEPTERPRPAPVVEQPEPVRANGGTIDDRRLNDAERKTLVDDAKEAGLDTKEKFIETFGCAPREITLAMLPLAKAKLAQLLLDKMQRTSPAAAGAATAEAAAAAPPAPATDDAGYEAAATREAPPEDPERPITEAERHEVIVAAKAVGLATGQEFVAKFGCKPSALTLAKLIEVRQQIAAMQPQQGTASANA